MGIDDGFHFAEDVLFREKKPLDDLIGNTCQEHDDSDGINGMHHFQVKTCWPVRVLFSEEVHIAKLIKKESPPSYSGGSLIIFYWILFLFERNATVSDTAFFS